MRSGFHPDRDPIWIWDGLQAVREKCRSSEASDAEELHFRNSDLSETVWIVTMFQSVSEQRKPGKYPPKVVTDGL